MKPYFIKTVLGLLIYFFDFIIVVIFSTLPLYLKPNADADKIGRFHIYTIIGTFAASWLIIAWMIFLVLYRKFRKAKIISEETKERSRIERDTVYIYIYIYIETWKKFKIERKESATSNTK